MPTTSIKAIIRPSSAWNGKSDKVYIIVLVSSKRRRYSVGISGNKANFDSEAGKFKGGSDESRQKNRMIAEKIGEMDRIIRYLELENPNFTINDFHTAYSATNVKNEGQYTVFSKFIHQETALRKSSVADGTHKHYKSFVKHIEEFKPGATISDITFDYLTRFYTYLREKEIGANTAYGYMKRVRVFVRLAINKGLMKPEEYPFRNFKIKSVKSERGFLTEDQVRLIINARNLTPGQDAARSRFIFQCYEGLRFSELNSLRWKNIQGDMIIMVQPKTRETVSVPLMQGAQEIIAWKIKPDAEELVFTPITNQKYNEHLKEIQKKLEIPVHLTTHVARHTYATLALTYGVSMETVSSNLGHTTLKSTQIYGRIVDMKKREEMKKFALYQNNALKVVGK